MTSNRRDVTTVCAIGAITLLAMLSSPINPWPLDDWFTTQYLLFSQAPGADDYAPIAAPALYFKLTHWIAAALSLSLTGEFYVAALGQNILLAISAYFVYVFFRAAGAPRLGVYMSLGVLLVVQATGLPQAFWSENVCLFLVAATVAAFGKLYFRSELSRAEFWGGATIVALSIGLLVLTRVVPIFFIPVICALLYGRLPRRRLVVLALATCVVTASLIMGQLVANDWRFGRFELTDSSGRHLWQGVRTIADVSLANSAEYRAIRARVPPTTHLDWWDLSLPGDPSDLALDHELGKLAKEAIVDRPDLYAEAGILNFAYAIPGEPYRLGFYAKRPDYPNPLKRDTFLPSAAEALLGRQPALAAAVVSAMSGVYWVTSWVYPAAIYLAMLTLAVVVIDLLRRAVFQRSKGVNRGALVAGISSVLFVVAGVGCLVDTAFIHRTVVEKALISTICLALFFYVAKVVSNRARANGNWVDLSTKGLDDTRAFTLWSVLFFGSMWFSWQIEAPNSRNVLPYLPVLAIMFGAAIRSWGLRESLETGAQHEGIDFRQEVLGWLSSTRSAHRL